MGQVMEVSQSFLYSQGRTLVRNERHTFLYWIVFLVRRQPPFLETRVYFFYIWHYEMSTICVTRRAERRV
jgi:hypothetical protein